MIAAFLRLIGLGAIIAAVSEVWFYPVDIGGGFLELVLFYGVIAYACWSAAAWIGVRTWIGAFWVACLFGFLIEGVPVPVLYEAMPFTIFWTSITWHALISIGVGLWVMRAVMARGTGWQAAMFCSLFGIYLGGFSTEMWALEVEGGPWVWHPRADFAQQMVVGWAMFLVGHILLDRASRGSVQVSGWHVGLSAGLVTLAYIAGPLLLVFPLSLALLPLVALAVWTMTRDGGARPSPVLVRLSNSTIPAFRYPLTILMPAFATLTYSALMTADFRPESAAVNIMLLGPVSLALVVWSLWQALRRPTRGP